ncbi:MAG: choice-of-anchor B family protein [bacterium]|nr:choice-of-anchor B family protein [bacterium]
MSLAIRRAPAPLLTGAVLCAVALAHDDDPKRLARPVLNMGVGQTFQAGPGTTSQNLGFPSLNVQLLSQLTLGQLGATAGGNDCWGYVSPSGREYAIMGTESETIFVDVTVPTNPQVIGDIDGPNGTWRDIKVYGEYAYSVCETNGQGIQVIDLTQIDNGTISLTNTVNGAGSGKSHNVAIDEDSGYLYRCGGNGNGLRIYDLNANPTNPPFVGDWQDRYVHDAQIVTYTTGPLAGKEIAYCSSGFNGGWDSTGLTIVDVTNKSNPVVMDQLNYSNAEYSHQGWLSEDRQYYYHGDELDEGNLGIPTKTFIIDVADPNNISEVGTFTNGDSATGHNLYTRGEFIYEANYKSGLRVFDASNPVAPVEVGYIDTYTSSGGSQYSGAWSCYPYLPSGIILISDRSEGLIIVWHGEPIVGENYCSPATPNSSGLPGRIHALGSAEASLNDLSLRAINLPSNEFGYFLTSLAQGSFMPPGSMGTICLGGQIARFNGQVQNTGIEGAFEVSIDLGNIPTSPSQAVVAGQTWYYQGWFRDGASSNLTDGTEVDFF